MRITPTPFVAYYAVTVTRRRIAAAWRFVTAPRAAPASVRNIVGGVLAGAAGVTAVLKYMETVGELLVSLFR